MKELIPAVVLGSIVGSGFLIVINRSTLDNADHHSSVALQVVSPSPVVTKSEYARLSNGISYWDARQIIGESGEELSRNHMDGVPGVMQSIDTVMYSWTNHDGSNMNAMFQNDRLMQKAQFGLR